MPNKMPEDIEKMLYELDNHDDIERIQKQWFEYQSANTLYEKQYSQQFGNIVEGNLKFKENKSIPTPAEHMHQLNDQIRQELYELHGKGKEQVYYTEQEEPDSDNYQPDNSDKFEDFKLTWSDISQKETDNTREVQQDNVNLDFRLDWDQSQTAANDNYQLSNDSKESIDQDLSDRDKMVEDFKLTFDTIGQIEQEVDEKELETGRDEPSFEYDDD